VEGHNMRNGRNFNSTLVRLKVEGAHSIRGILLTFQFHTGSIKRFQLPN